MTVTTTVAHAHEELREDHRRLHALVDRLRAAEDLEALARVLEELHTALTAHFNAEEKPGGLYDAFGVCAPEFRPALGPWTITSSSRRLCATCATAPAGPRPRARRAPGRRRRSSLGPG
jgi:hypothetical protein